MKYYCNPINVNYRYQFNKNLENDKIYINREAADPSMICFKGTYYIFASMNLSVWVSEDLVSWQVYKLPENLPLYGYAPDVRVCGEYVYFCASESGEKCNYYRTKDIINGPYEEIEGTFGFVDPNLFFDEDGKVYFYWGCSDENPIWGTELDSETMKPIGEKKALIYGNPFERGYERKGTDHSEAPEKKEPEGTYTKMPWIEGAWMNKYQGKYYLQYACPGTELNGYGDGVYISDTPLGPFEPAENNPYSYHPGGFMPGAGHGSTMCDKQGSFWHTSTMQISVNHMFERRVGIWKAGFDQDGELFCNQRYGDWPIAVDEKTENNLWKAPDWYLLSYKKKIRASSEMTGKEAALAVNEDATNWWQSKTAKESVLELDLEKVYDVRAVQINFADDKIDIPIPGEIQGARFIDGEDHVTRWKLEGSANGCDYEVMEDKSETDTDLPHDLVVRETGIQVRFLRLTIYEVPYGQKPCVSGFRVFGIGDGEKPGETEFTVQRSADGLDMIVSAKAENATGYNILWGHRKEKLYHSYLVYGEKLEEKRIGALVKESGYYVRVDTFNENGITEGTVIKTC